MGKLSLDRRYSVLLHPNVLISHAVNILGTLGLFPESQSITSVKEPWTLRESPFHSYVGNNIALWAAIERWYKLYGLRNAKWFRNTSSCDGPWKVRPNSIRESDTHLHKAGIDMNLIDLCFSFQAVLDSSISNSQSSCPIPTTDMVIICDRENTDSLCSMARTRSLLLPRNGSVMFDHVNQSDTIDFGYNRAFPLELQMWIVSLSSEKSKSEVIQFLPSLEPVNPVNCVKNWLGPTN